MPSKFIFLAFVAPILPVTLTAPALGATLSINETQSLSFATLEKPGGGSQSLTISPAGGTSGSGSVLYGTARNGNYNILSTGASPPATISIDIANVQNGGGYSFSNFKGQYDGSPINSFPAVGLQTPDGIAKTLRIGATVTYDNSVPTSPLTPTFDIVVDYE